MKNTCAFLRGFVILLFVVGATGIIGPDAFAQFDEEKEVTGVVEAVDALNNAVTVDGVEYTVTDETEYEGLSGLSDLSSGDEVEVEYEETVGGREALEVETTDAEDGEDEEEEDKEEEADEKEVSGTIEAVDNRVLTIDGTDYAVSDQTEYEGIDGLSDLSSGDKVKIEYKEKDGGREAIEVELAGAEDDN